MALLVGAGPRAGLGQVDSLGGVFRRVLVQVAAAGRVARLDSAALEPGVRREVRVYAGFGLGVPHRMVRLWEDGAGVHGWYGVFWPVYEHAFTYSSPADARRGRAEMRTPDARMHAYVDTTYACAALSRAGAMNVCWLAKQADRDSWAHLLAEFDRLGVNSVPSPARRRSGRDGWSVVVEVRSPVRYRAYWYWMPDTSAVDPGERATAAIGAAVENAFGRRLAK